MGRHTLENYARNSPLKEKQPPKEPPKSVKLPPCLPPSPSLPPFLLPPSSFLLPLSATDEKVSAPARGVSAGRARFSGRRTAMPRPGYAHPVVVWSIVDHGRAARAGLGPCFVHGVIVSELVLVAASHVDHPAGGVGGRRRAVPEVGKLGEPLAPVLAAGPRAGRRAWAPDPATSRTRQFGQHE